MSEKAMTEFDVYAASSSPTIQKAVAELRMCGQIDEDPRFALSILRALDGFLSYGHSGGSAEEAKNMLMKLLDGRSLSPLTSEPEEWIDRTEETGSPFWQNKRDSKAFSEDGGKTWWIIDDPTD